MSDALWAAEINCIAPSQAAGRIETSKAFAKDLMHQYQIPTAAFKKVSSISDARAAINDFGFPVVLKADGLAAGKGVFIVESPQEAESALAVLFSKAEGTEIIIEEYLQGWEVSLFAICDGLNYQTTIFSQDHKQLYDHDLGPNTGGMGAIAPVPEADSYLEQIKTNIISPILAAMKAANCPFAGILYCGLMITPQGPKVLEFNCRWGDPEAQAVLALLRTDMIEICDAIQAGKVDRLKLQWQDKHAVAVVLASKGYPDSPVTGFPISIKDDAQINICFAGVTIQAGQLVTSGGRVMTLTALAQDQLAARTQAYEAINNVHFEGMHYRTDIGLRANSLKAMETK